MATLCAVAVFLLLAPMASAAGEVEPDNDIISAFGPIGSTAYVGTLQDAGEEDWYWLQLAGGQQITFSAAFNSESCFFPNASAYLTDYYGSAITRLEAPTFEYGVTQQYRYTTPGAGGTYYIEVAGSTDNAGCEYEFEVTPPSAFAPAPPKPPAVAVTEPDDFQSEAHPIGAGTVYAGRIDTSNDVDRLYFEAKANQAVSVELAGGGCGGSIEADVKPPDGSKEFPQTAYASAGSRGTAELKTFAGGRFEILVSGDLGCEWQLLLSPASALGADAPKASHLHPCRDAKRALARRRYRLHRLERTLPFVSAARRPQLLRQIAGQKHSVKSARHAVRAECTGGNA